MRKIKFRGLRTDGRGWCYGLIVKRKSKYFIEVEFTDLEDDVIYRAYEVAAETIGQFTGLKDKNGVEIYEGDLFTEDQYPFVDEREQNYIGEVCWLFAGFQYYLKCVNPKKRGISEGINEPIEDGDWMEVIGNIHESETEPKGK